MKRIDLTKYGFVRAPEEDFSDDGTRFTCYRIGDVRVSKASWQGMAFIAGRYIGKTGLSYEEYSKLPHYKDMSSLNGLDSSLISEADLIAFRDACVAYQREIEQAESQIAYPTEAEIADARRKVINARLAEFEDAKSKIAESLDKVFQMSPYELNNLRDRYASLSAKAHPAGTDEEFAENVAGSAYGRDLADPKYVERESAPSFEYREIVQALAK